MIAYLDTNVAIWLSQGNVANLSEETKGVIRRADLLISPMVLLELAILHEIRRTKLTSRDIQFKIEHELGVRVCGLEFSSIVATGV